MSIYKNYRCKNVWSALTVLTQCINVVDALQRNSSHYKLTYGAILFNKNKLPILNFIYLKR